jgi:hypothetical protein
MDSASTLSDDGKEQHLRLTQFYAIVSDPSRSSIVPSRTRLDSLVDAVGLSAHARRLVLAAYNFGVQASRSTYDVEMTDPSSSFAEYNTPMKL